MQTHHDHNSPLDTSQCVQRPVSKWIRHENVVYEARPTRFPVASSSKPKAMTMVRAGEKPSLSRVSSVTSLLIRPALLSHAPRPHIRVPVYVFKRIPVESSDRTIIMT